MEVINKKALTDLVAEETGDTKKHSGEVIEAVFFCISNELAKGNTVDLAGFGKFVVKERNERSGVNPATGEKITISASKAPSFKASSTLKKVVK